MKRIKNLFHHSKTLALSKTAIFTYVVFTGNLSSAVLAFLFTVILARKLSIADFGYFSALSSLLLLVSDLSDIGIGSTLSTFLPRMEKTKEILLSFLKAAFLVQVAIAVVISMLIYLLSNIVGELLFHKQTLDQLIKINSWAILFTILANFFVYALSARQKFITVSFLSAFGSAVRLVFLIIVMVFFHLNLSSSIWIQTITQFVLFVVCFYSIGHQFLRSEKSRLHIPTLLSFSYLLGIARGFTAIASRLDVLMIIALIGPTEAGIYAYASRVIAIYPLLAGSFSTVIAPKFASIEKGHVNKFIFKVMIATAGIILSNIIMIILAYPFMSILFGAKGLMAASVFQLLLLAMIFFVASVPSVSLAIYYLKKPYILTVNSVLQVITVLLGNFIFIPKFGRFGAAYSLIAAYGISLLLTSFLSFYHLQKKHGDN